MEYYDHAMSGAVLALAAGAHRRFGPAIVAASAGAAAFPDWDDLPGGVHRVWGHSLLIAPFAGGLIGAVGYLCYHSSRRSPNAAAAPRGLWVWVLTGVLASLCHVLADLAYCGQQLNVEWPVALFWPVSRHGWAFPLVPWADRGMTLLLSTALVAACLLPTRARLVGALALLTAIAYVGLWGTWALVRG
jgi:membrane-bound metal-dependent hydrolase YbcI (DUF457 family)